MYSVKLLRARSLGSLLSLVGLVASIGLAYLAFRNVNVHRFWASLRTSNYWWILLSFLVLLVGLLLKAIRWRLMFTRETRPSLGATTRAMLVGYFFNSILPARPGEAIRVVFLHREAGTSRAEALGTAVAERLYDILVLLALLFVSVPFLPHVTWLRRAGVVAVALFAVLVVMIVVIEVWQERPVRLLLRPLVLMPSVAPGRLEVAAGRLTRGLAALHRPRVAVPAVAVTVVAYLTIACSFWVGMFAFDLHLGLGSGLLVAVTVTLGQVIPSGPAGVGVFEAAVLLALRAYGIDDSRALSYAAAVHFVNFAPFVVMGLLTLQRYSVMPPRGTDLEAEAHAGRGGRPRRGP